MIDPNRVFIIAEISANHGHDINIAKETILKAKECGADAVKIQTYTADTITLDCDNEYFQINNGTIWDGTTLHKLYQEASLPYEWHEELFRYAKEIGITLFSTPFDFSAVDLLETCDNPIYKIASFEINDIPLIQYCASKQKPMIISTGIASLEDIEECLRACHSQNNYDITLLKCTSEYPAKLEDANLDMISDFKQRFNTKVGLSDHTMGWLCPLVAVSKGARVIEKHFIIDRSIGGPDASFSMDYNEFKEMVTLIRDVEKTFGTVNYELTPKKLNSRKYARSLFISQDIKKGELITQSNIKSVRPSDGLAPKYYYEVLGKKASRDLEFGQPLHLEDVE